MTVFGESAGAILISLLYLDPTIKTFHSAIMESGAQSVAPIGPTGTTFQAVYDDIVMFTNCSASNGTGTGTPARNQSSFECLKSLPAEALLAAQLETEAMAQYAVAFVFAPSIDGALIPDSPHTLLAEGKFAKIPFISGNNQDESVVPFLLHQNYFSRTGIRY